MPHQGIEKVANYYAKNTNNPPYTSTNISTYNLTYGYNYLDFRLNPLSYPPHTLVAFNFDTGKVGVGSGISTYADRRLNLGTTITTNKNLTFYVKAFAFTVNTISHALSRTYANYGPYPVSAVFENREGKFIKANTIINVIKRMYLL